MERVELHCRTNLSTIDPNGFCDVRELIETAHDLEHKAIAICDYATIAAYPAAQLRWECISNNENFKMLYGVQTTVDASPDGDWDSCPPYEVTLLAKNDDGIKAIYRLLSTEGTQRGFYDIHTLDYISQMAAVGNILVGASAITGNIWNALIRGAADEDILPLLDFYDYVEIAPPVIVKFFSDKLEDCPIEEIQSMIKRLIELAGRKGKPVIATGLTNFVSREDALAWAAYTDFDGDIDELPPMHLMITDEMMEQFHFLGDDKAAEIVVKNPNHIADLCDQAYPRGKYEEQLLPRDDNLVNELKEKTYSAARNLYNGDIPKNVKERLDTELGHIIQIGFGEMLMLAGKLAAFSIERGYPVAAGGTLGNLFVAYLLGLSAENPLEQGLPWQSCLGWDGDKGISIDLLVAPEIRRDLIKRLREMLPKGEVIRCSAMSDDGRRRESWDLLYDYIRRHKIVVASPEVYAAQGLLDVKCIEREQIHPAAVMIIPDRDKMYDRTPITRCAPLGSGDEAEEYTSVLSYQSLNSLYGDFELIRDERMSLIHKLQEMTDVKYKDIDIYDENLIKAVVAGEAAGVPEFGEKFNRLAQKLLPKTFYDLVKIYGFFDGEGVWENNQEHLIGDKEDALQIAISHRDDVYKSCLSLGIDQKTAFMIMECVRKGKGVSYRWLDELEAHNAPSWLIEALDKMKYLLPLSQSADRVRYSLIILWYKLNRPQEFYQAYYETYAAKHRNYL